MNDIEKKVADYEKRYNVPYVQLVEDQLSVADNAINEGDRERIRQSLWCTFDMVSPYLGVSKYRLKKRILDLGNITNHTEFITEADKIYHIVLKFKEEKIDKINQ